MVRIELKHVLFKVGEVYVRFAAERSWFRSLSFRLMQPPCTTPTRLFKLPGGSIDVFLVHQKTRGHWRGE
jgi:hypothetical protein